MRTEHMRCAECRREDPTVQPRDFCPAYLCDLCNHYEELWHNYYINSNKITLAEQRRLYDQIIELGSKIASLKTEAIRRQCAPARPPR